ncbi:MAG: dehydrogenase, partial [Porticoccaceae bacterium]
CHPGISSALTAIPGVVFAGHLDGVLRAYDGATGAVLWETDTTRPVTAVNGLTATGGSMSGPGPAIADGHLIVNSGYSYAMFKPGNALLVYAVDDK